MLIGPSRDRTPGKSVPCKKSARRLLLEMLEDRCVPSLMGNQVFPADNPWNQKITSAPVAANSATLVASIGASQSLHPDFGTVWDGAYIGIPYNVVPGTQPKVNVIIDAYPDESDLVPIPIPSNAVIEGDPLPSSQNTGDRHLLVYDKDHNILYETFNTHRPSEEPDGQWHADSESVWDLNKDSFRTPGYTSADAAGLPILPGLVRPDEVLDQAVITHALRFTVPATDNAYVFPASHVAGSDNPNLPRMGERFRLKQSFDISGFSHTDQIILQALKDYGMIVADNGSAWYLSGAPSSRWDDSDLHNLSQLVGSDFEAVDLTPRVSSLGQTSGSANGGTQVTINGINFSGGAGMTQVYFGSTAATSITIVSDTQIIATAPAHTVGQVDVTVYSPYGTSATSAADHFTYTQALPVGQFQFSASAYRANENAGSITITVTRTNGSAGTATVQYATSDGSARAGLDYTSTSGTLTFTDGVTTQTFNLPVLDDHVIGEPDESLQLSLSNPTNSPTLGTPATATVTMVENNSPGVSGTLIASGAGPGHAPEVRVFRALGEALLYDFDAYPTTFLGGVRVAVGDVTGDGVPDIVTAPGAGLQPKIKVFDGTTGVMVNKFLAYTSTFTGGVFIAVADVNHDGIADIITGTGPGTIPHVKVFSSKDGSLLWNFVAYDRSFTGGVRVAAADVNGDGYADIITAPGVGMTGTINVYSGKDLSLLRQISAGDASFTGGWYVAAADINNDGHADIILGAGPGTTPLVQVYSGADGSLLHSFLAFASSFTGGVRVGAVADVNADGGSEILVSKGPGADPLTKLIDGQSLTVLDRFYAYDPSMAGGSFIGGQ